MARLRLGVIADIHAGPPDAPVETWQGPYAPAKGIALARRAAELIRERGVDGLAVLGDSANAGDHASLVDALAALAVAGAPTWIVAGNVDLRLDQSALERALAASQSAFSIPKTHGEPAGGFTLAGLRFQGAADDEIALDARPDFSAWADAAVILLSHYPVISRRRAALAAGWNYSGDALGLDGLADELASRAAPTIVLHGHLHLADATARGSLLQLGFPALAENGHRAAIVAIDHDDGLVLETRLFAAVGDGQPAAIQTPAFRWTYAAQGWRSSGRGGDDL